MKILAAILLFTTLVCQGQEVQPSKLGLGFVVIENTYDSKKIVTIYKDKDLTSKLEDFRLYGEHKSIRPYYDKPDYGLCYFICLEKTQSYYKVLFNNNDEGFLKADSEKHFKTWESVLINSSVQRIDVKSNPLKENPSYSAANVIQENKPTVNLLQVDDVIEKNGEHWIKVKFSKSGKARCDPNIGDCHEAWIKWRSGDKLLVNILLLC